MATTTSRSIGVGLTLAVLIIAGIVLAVDTFPGRTPTDVDVTLREYRFHPAELTVAAGRPVTLTFTNDDDVAHDVSFGRGVELESDRPVGYSEDLLAGLQLDIQPRESLSSDARGHTALTVAPGSRVTLRVTLPVERVGTWEVGCFQTLGCHYAAGLHGTLRVVD